MALLNCFLVAFSFPYTLLAHSSQLETLRYFEYVQYRITNYNRSEFHFTPHSHFHMTIFNFNQTLHLHLKPNSHLLHTNMIKESQDHLVYTGYVYDKKSTTVGDKLDYHLSRKHDLGTVSLVVTLDVKGPSFHGTIQFEGTTYNLQSIHGLKSIHGAEIPAANARRHQDKLASTIIYRTRDLEKPTDQHSTCSTKVPPMPRQTPFSLKRRDTSCSSTKVLFMAVAADCSYVEYYQTVKQAKAAIISDWTEVSRVYEKAFGLKLGLFHVYVPHATCQNGAIGGMEWNRPCNGDYYLSERLDDFSVWAVTSPYPNVMWHLRTRCPYDNKIGYAYSSESCNSLTHTVSGGKPASKAVGVSSITSESWKVIAHEIGHNFGATHDCDGTTCKDSNEDCCKCATCDCNGKFLMTAIATNHATEFSPCSAKQICRGIGAVAGCLSGPQDCQLIGRSVCGNGVKEEGEECDCGGIAGCKGNGCCDPSTCKLKPKAKCDDSTDKCCQSCQLKALGEVCRDATGSCDKAETCDGVTATCPVDNFLPNGAPCGNNLYCASGQCTSRDLQCRQNIQTPFSSPSEACGDSSDQCRLVCTGKDSKCSIYPIDAIDGTKCGHNSFCQGGICPRQEAINTSSKTLNHTASLELILPIAVGLCIFTVLFVVLSKVFRKAPAQDPASFPDPPPIHPASAEPRRLPRRGARSRPGLPDFTPIQSRPLSSIPLMCSEDN